MKILGLTGGSGAGKSAACAAFTQLGCGVIDADASYRMLCETCRSMLDEIQSIFFNILTTDGKLDRKKLGAVVFADPDKLLQLNAITHPYIRQAARDAFDAFAQQGCQLCVYDAPVLFEAGMQTECDATCAVLATREARIARIMLRDAITEEYAALRIDAQKPDAFYRERCDYIIQNDADLDSLYVQARRIHDDILRQSPQISRKEQSNGKQAVL